MRRTMKKLLATAFAGVLALTGTVSMNLPTKAAEESTESYKLFLAFGGDAAEENDWALGYAGGDASEGMTVTDAEIAVGETATISIEFAEPVVNAWYFAPTMIAENVQEADFTVEAYVDGEQVDLDMAAGDNWWYEATGDYADTEAVRIAGGFNEWGAQYMAEPAGFTKLEYKITANSIKVGEAEAVNAVASDEEYDMFLAFGGDAAEENDWALGYAGGDASEGMTVTDAKIKAGETATVSIEFAEPVVNAWYFAPVIVASGVVEADFTVEAAIDGNPVELDMTAGDNWWYEATGDYDDTQTLRVAGGFNEWGAQYMAEPSGFTKIEFTVTANKIMVGEAVEAEPEGLPTGNIDLDGVYHAYIGFQSPTYSFRNAWDGDDGYGNDTPEFNQVTGWDSEGNEVVRDGSFTDVEIAGNGTYTVSANGLDLEGDFDAQEYMNLIFFSTDIPTTADVTFSDVSLKVNGSSVTLSDVIVTEENTCLRVMLQNIWVEEIKALGYYSVPVTDISITFTVSGFNYENEAVDVAEEETGDDAATTEAEKKDEKKSSNNIIIIIVVAVVVVIGAVVGIVLGKKKK